MFFFVKWRSKILSSILLLSIPLTKLFLTGRLMISQLRPVRLNFLSFYCTPGW